MQRARRQPRGVAGLLADGFLAQAQQRRVERPGVDPPQPAPLDRDVVLPRRPLRRVVRLAEHRGEDAGVQRPLIERDFADAGHRGHNLRLDVDDADGADDAGAGLRMPRRDRAAFERRLRGREKGVATHRNRRRSRVSRLPGEAKHVALDAEGPEHHARRLPHRFEHRPLLDVQLEIRPRVDRLQLTVRVEHPVERDPVFRERIDQPRALPICQLAHLLDLQAPGGGRRPEQAATEPSAFFVRPVHELQRHRRPGARVHPQRLEGRHHTEAAVEPSAIRHRVEMAADDDGLWRRAGHRHPVVAGRIRFDRQSELGNPALEPVARVAP